MRRAAAITVGVALCALGVALVVSIIVSGRNADRAFDRQHKACVDSGRQWIGSRYCSKGCVETFTCREVRSQ